MLWEEERDRLREDEVEGAAFEGFFWLEEEVESPEGGVNWEPDVSESDSEGDVPEEDMLEKKNARREDTEACRAARSCTDKCV